MAKKVVIVLGVIFVLIGLLGFMGESVLGIFPVDLEHNLVHLVSGVLAIFFAMKGEAQAKQFAKVFGVIYLVVGLLGLVWTGDQLLGFLTSDFNDDVLHIVLGLVFAWVGWSKPKMMGGMSQPQM